MVYAYLSQPASYRRIFALAVIFAFACAFGIGANDVVRPCLQTRLARKCWLFSAGEAAPAGLPLNKHSTRPDGACAWQANSFASSVSARALTVRATLWYFAVVAERTDTPRAPLLPLHLRGLSATQRHAANAQVHALQMTQAIAVAAVCEFLGAVLLGSSVTGASLKPFCSYDLGSAGCCQVFWCAALLP